MTRATKIAPTTTPVDSTAQAKDDQLRPWLARASILIGDRLADARAHAEAGRWADAEQRFDELRKRLLDDQSGAGSLLSNARAAFYRAAFHLEPFDPAIHQDGVRPEPAGELTARFAAIGGANQYIEGRQVLERAAGVAQAPCGGTGRGAGPAVG